MFWIVRLVTAVPRSADSLADVQIATTRVIGAPSYKWIDVLLLGHPKPTKTGHLRNFMHGRKLLLFRHMRLLLTVIVK